MLNKLFKKMDEIKEDVLDQASKTLSDAGTNAKDRVTESINKKQPISSLL